MRGLAPRIHAFLKISDRAEDVDTRIKPAHDRVGCAHVAAGRADDAAHWVLD
jgi:hypothetical protein